MKVENKLFEKKLPSPQKRVINGTEHFLNPEEKVELSLNEKQEENKPPEEKKGFSRLVKKAVSCVLLVLSVVPFIPKASAQIMRNTPSINYNIDRKKDDQTNTQMTYVPTVNQDEEVTESAKVSVKNNVVMLEIDGLSYELMGKALKDGYMPNLQRLMEEKDFKLHPYYCGVPSNTPASLSGLMYANNYGIPGFYWFDKESSSLVGGERLESLFKEIEGRAMKEGKEGLLTGGSVHSAAITGGAKEKDLIPSDVSRIMAEDGKSKGIFHAAKQIINTLANFATHPIRSIETFGFSSPWELANATVDCFADPEIKGLSLAKRIKYPLNRVLMNTILRDGTTIAVEKDLKKGVPVTYASFDGHDKVAHMHGPESKAALKVLKGIDRQIGRIYEKTNFVVVSDHKQPADKPSYNLIVISDHGQTPSEPFYRIYGEKLSQLLDQETRKTNLREKVYACGAGSLSNVYFSSAKKQLNLKDIEYIYPSVINLLKDHQGIGVVVGRDTDETVILGKEGKISIDKRKNNKVTIEGKNPLSMYGDEQHCEILVRQIDKLASMPNSGDLILFGAYDGKKSVDLEELTDWRGCHGGIGGPQEIGFVFTDQKIDTSKVESSKDLYPIFEKLIPK